MNIPTYIHAYIRDYQTHFGFVPRRDYHSHESGAAAICSLPTPVKAGFGPFVRNDTCSTPLTPTVGVNPFATITALAERTVEKAAQKRRWTIDYATKNGRLDLFGPPKVRWPMSKDLQAAQTTITAAGTNTGVRFCEIMEGHIYIGDDIEDFTVAESKAKGASSAARFYLTVDSYSTENCRLPVFLRWMEWSSGEADT